MKNETNKIMNEELWTKKKVSGREIEMMVMDYIVEQLSQEPRVCSETIQEQVYLRIVDKLPACSITDDIASAAGELYEKLTLIDSYINEPIRITTASDFDGLIIDRIKARFTKAATISTIYNDFVDCGFSTICEDDIQRAVDDLTVNEEDWK